MLRKAGKTNYQDSVNLPLWAEIQKQFRPYNPNGKDPFQSGKSLSLVEFQFFNYFLSDSPAKHQMAYKGEIWQEYEREKENREAQFRKEKAEEEAANLALLKENPEMKDILDEQAKVLEQIRVKKFQEEQSKSDAEFARKLQKEEEKKLSHKKIKNSPEKISDAEYARRLQEELNREYLNGRQSDHKNLKNSGFLEKSNSLPTKSPTRKKIKNATPSKSKYSPVVHYSPSPPDENFFASRQRSPSNHDRTKQEEADRLFALKLSENEKFHARKIKLKNKNDTPKIDKFYRSYGVKRARVSSSDSDSSIYGLKATTSKPEKAIRINSSDDDDQTQLVHSGTTSKTSLLYYL